MLMESSSRRRQALYSRKKVKGSGSRGGGEPAHPLSSSPDQRWRCASLAASASDAGRKLFRRRRGRAADPVVRVAVAGRRTVTEPPKIIPYYRLSRSTWPLSNNKELLSRFRRVKPGKSHTTGSLICAKPTRRRQHYVT
jgi:hypothetical protein